MVHQVKPGCAVPTITGLLGQISKARKELQLIPFLQRNGNKTERNHLDLNHSILDNLVDELIACGIDRLLKIYGLRFQKYLGILITDPQLRASTMV